MKDLRLTIGITILALVLVWLGCRQDAEKRKVYIVDKFKIESTYDYYYYYVHCRGDQQDTITTHSEKWNRIVVGEYIYY